MNGFLAQHLPEKTAPHNGLAAVDWYRPPAMALVIRLSDEKSPPPPKRKEQSGLALEERTRTKKPPMYKVLLHNDDYTTKEFVVFVLQSVFHRSEVDAIAIMEHVHNH